MASQIKIGVSSCLLGERVRYDGSDKREPYIADVLGRIFALVPVCPEVGCGLPVPREVMRLEGDPVHPRLVTVESRLDLTERLHAWCRLKVKELEGENIAGFILKSRSPSCGLFRVEVFSQGRTESGRGLFAAALTAYFPDLPVEEEGRLGDVRLREEFIERASAYRHRRKREEEAP
ncbi:MAG TPA: DUF523 domain-containing protein [Geobacteraceae bacterium]